MAQSVTWSWIESILLGVILFAVAQGTFAICHINLGIGLSINIFLTMVSLVAKYYVRRMFIYCGVG